MTPAPRPDEETLRRLAEASAWRVQLAEAGAESSGAFEAWLAEHPANEAAWRRIQAPWALVGEHATAPELMAVRTAALNDARRQGRRRWSGRFLAARAAAAGLALAVLVAGAFGLAAWQQGRPDVYATTLGERRVIPLADGSRVTLDSGSEVRIRYSDDARRLELKSGQARFDVARDERRPFLVQARDQTVVATGTAFNVDLLGPKVLVTLIEGHVVVLGAGRAAHDADEPRITPSPRVALQAGQQLVVAAAAVPTLETVSLQQTSAWETGQLMFEDEPLGAVAERVSRYTDRPITVEPSAAALRISGVFRAGDVDTFLDAVTSYLPVAASPRDAGGVALRRRG
jgi:transmembrane sensor